MNTRKDSSGVRISPRLIAGAILTVLALIFVFQNRNTASLDFLFFHLDWALWIVLLITLLVGIAIGWFTARRRD